MKKTYSLLLIILLTLSLSSCYQLFQGKIPMNNAKPGTTLDEVMQEKEKISQLKAPSQIFVSQGLLCDKIEISWSAVDYASNYRLERAVKNASDTKLPEDSDFEVIKASGSSILSSSYVSGTKYTDLILPNPSYTSEEYNKIYYYRVSAENPQAGYTSSDYAVSEKAFLFSPVPNVSASAGESEEEVTVTWNAVPKASWYNIYRSADSTNANPVLLSTVSGNVFQYSNKIGTSEQGLDFYYTVKAVNANNHSSVTSAVSLGYALKNGAPSRVTGVKISNGKGRGDGPASDGIEVSWTSAGADTKYTVFRYSSKDSSITQLATGLTATSVVDKKALKPNVYYYYKVLAYKTVSNGTTNEDIKGPMSTDTAEGFIISPPEDIAVNKIGSRCEIKFSQTIGEKGFLSDSGNSTDYNTYSYIIKGGNDQNDISQTVTFEEVYPVNGYYTVIANEYYKFYQIFAKNDKGKESAASSIVAPSPSPCQNVKATKAAFIEGEMTVATSNHNNTWTGANANEVFPVKITWEAPKDG
ncbi:MAG: hypothetical protein HUK25_10035, partial [Treponema sp.]|nr:hypothetical protein [Treponema sp.]